MRCRMDVLFKRGQVCNTMGQGHFSSLTLLAIERTLAESLVVTTGPLEKEQRAELLYVWINWKQQQQQKKHVVGLGCASSVWKASSRLCRAPVDKGRSMKAWLSKSLVQSRLWPQHCKSHLGRIRLQTVSQAFLSNIRVGSHNHTPRRIGKKKNALSHGKHFPKERDWGGLMMNKLMFTAL